MLSERYDYIIVGAGASGCVLANRLSADPLRKVLLIEAGADQPPGHEHPAIRDPYPVSLAHAEFSWPDLNAEVGPDRGDGRPRLSRRYLQGRGVGGGSNIQGMVALRGVPGDYDEWARLGAKGWSWADVLPYFRRLERDLDFDGPMHGDAGPIPIRRVKTKDWAPFAKAFGEWASSELGLASIDDFNGDFRAGVGPLPMANLPTRRVSTSMGYLDDKIRSRSNLTVLPNAFVKRVKFHGRVALGVVARVKDADHFYEGGETILCAGAIHSPAISMCSGVGPGRHLRELGIDVISDLPGVGQRLMNHVNINLATHLSRSAEQPWSARGFGQSCIQTSSGVDDCDHDLLLCAVNRAGWHPLGRRIAALIVEVHRTHSLGEVRLRGSDPTISPRVVFNLLSDPRDMARLLEGLRLALRALRRLQSSGLIHEVFLPRPEWVQALGRLTPFNWLRSHAIAALLEIGDVRRVLMRDSIVEPDFLLGDSVALRALALACAGPPHHVAGTCKMGGPEDKEAVVAPDCRVRGVDRLRIVDASIMPTLVRANTHVPTIMVAERMADIIVRKRPNELDAATDE